ncbi:hypothetical protein M3Y97_00169500 [Aphelenchoides bicaudatus]|nr:hypothetical protein M3Y97_00169500 [Aphelenchoides bicaudatus]
MCNTFLCTTGLARGLNYKLILLNNRDEVLDRKTSAAHWENNYLAGHDEQEKERGTWLGIRKDGRIGNTLSITEPEHIKDQRPLAPTRGTIVTDFLKTGALSAVQYCSDFTKKALNYNGFQFLALERNESDHYNVYSLTNRLVKEVKTCSWKEGIYCFGNSPHETPMKKVAYGEQIFKQFIEDLPTEVTEKTIVDGLMRIAEDSTQHFPDEQLAEQTGRDDSYNRYLSAIYVRFPPHIPYGTRCHTIILIDKENEVYFREQRLVEEEKWETSEFRFKLD